MLLDTNSPTDPLEAPYRLLAETMPQLGWMTDAEGSHTFFNRRWYEFTGLSEADSMGFGFATVLHPDDQARTVERWRRSWQEGEPYEIEYRFRRHDGVYRWFVGRAEPVRDPGGAITAWVGTCSDIDDQKRAEGRSHFLAEASTLLASSLDLEVTLSSVAQLAVPHLADWCSVHVLEGSGRVRQVTVAHVDPSKVRWALDLQHRYPADESAASGVHAVMRTGRSEMMSEIPPALLEASARDAEHLEIIRALSLRSYMSVAMVAHGRPVGAISFVAAESGRLYSQTDLELAEELGRRAGIAVDNAALNAELEKRVAQRTIELQRSNEELEQFAYVASHDLQEPLRMVSSYTQLLARRYRGKLDTDADEFIAYAVDGVTRMQKLINDLLAYSRVGTKGREPEPTPAGAALEDALANLRAATLESGAALTAGPLPTVLADPGQLRQVFQNLIGNALKFGREGEPPRVEVSAGPEPGAANLWRFSVGDHGIGIEPQYFDRIFVIFQRLHGKEEYAGSGIGLSIAKKIVERHGGRMWLESTPGEGTTFFFTLPGAPAAAHGTGAGAISSGR